MQAARALVRGLRSDHGVGDARGIVVLHDLADAAQFMRDRDADLAEMFGIADPRQLQDVRRADGTCRQDHLARRLGPPVPDLGRYRLAVSKRRHDGLSVGEPPELKERTINRVRSVLRAHQLTRAAAQ